MTERDIQPCLIYIDKEGTWFYKGSKMIRREFVRLFYDNMELDSQGRYIINWQGGQCYVDVEDTAFIVRRAELVGPDQAGFFRYRLYLSDDSREDLVPDTISVGYDNAFYCLVKSRTFPARFSRSAYYQLAEHIKEEGGRYYLPINGDKHIISWDPC